MIYLVFCSTDDVNGELHEHGRFVSVFNANSAEAVLDLAESRIEHLRQTSGMFDATLKIYIDEIIEISSVPVEGFVARHERTPGEWPGSIIASLPGVRSTGVNSVKLDNMGKDGAVVPFIDFTQEISH